MPDTLERRVYRGALLGLGGVAQQSHLPAYAHPAVHERLEIVAAVDPGPHVVPPRGIPLLRSVAELRALGPIDFVDICTPTATHVDLACWALEQGYHVLCEKPVATSRADARVLTAAARRAGRLVAPCHQYRHNPAWTVLRQWLDAGAIGRWHLAQMEVHRAQADGGVGGPGTPWRGRRAGGLGGVLIDHGTHLIYQMLDVAGMPSAVRGWTGRLRHASYDVEDTAQLVFEYPERAAMLLLTWAGTRRENRVRFVGQRGSIEWIGGTLRLETDGAVDTRDFTSQLDKRAYAGWFAALFLEFAAALDAAAADPYLSDIARVAHVLEAAYRAAEAPGVRLSPPPDRVRRRLRGAVRGVA